MTRGGENGNKPKKSGARGARLAAALRENLRRRKAQERSRIAPEPSDLVENSNPAVKDR
jgi:hypothetical protein